MANWTVLEKRAARKALEVTPPQVRKKYELWKTIMVTRGPEGIRAIKGFHDEALTDWEGYRSSRLNDQYRVIYRFSPEERSVLVKRVTPHDYRR
jgi:plasmid maintenance system killer protein